MKRRAALGSVWTSFFLIRSWAWFASAAMAADRLLSKAGQSQQSPGEKKLEFLYGSNILVQDLMG